MSSVLVWAVTVSFTLVKDMGFIQSIVIMFHVSVNKKGEELYTECLL